MKVFARQGVLLTLCAVFVLSMAGCPRSAVLSVQPRALTLSDTKSEAQLVVSNEGSGTLRWDAQTSVPWLLLAAEGDEERSQSTSGATTQSSILMVYLNKDLLPEETNNLTAVITIDSNGGLQEIEVAIQRVRTPLLVLEPAALEFDDTQSEQLIEVLNEGDGTLEWQIILPEDVDWISVSPSGGTVLRGSAAAVTVRINRALLTPSATPYTATLEVLSNGGEAALEISALASAFTAAPLAVGFGLLTQPETQLVVLSTLSEESVSLTITGAEPWLTLSATAANITRNNPYDLRLTANPVGLEPGDYTATVQVSNAATERTATIAVAMSVGPPVDFRLDPDTLDFGESREIVQLPFSIINAGEETLEWRIEKPTTAGWIEVSEDEGLLEDTVGVTVTANPTNLNPGTYNTNLTVYAGGISRVLRVTLTRPADPISDELQVEPQQLEFGTILNRLDINVWNEGPGQVDWSIDASTLPDWLVISPVSGTVGGALTQLLRVSVDRDLVPEDVDESIHVFEIASSVIGQEPVEVQVSVKPQRFPKIEVIGDGADAEDIPFIVINIGEDSKVFTIRNTGKADLNWAVDLTDMPAWITSVTPQQGQLAPNREQQVRVTTDRSGLDQSGGRHRFLIRSNDPEKLAAPLDVSVRVPFSIIIGTRPNKLNFGRTLSTLPFEVANMGDPGWPLDFVITTNHPDWVYIEPSRGQSVGTASPIKDWQLISVAIDRGRLTAGATATLTVSAENVPENALPVEPVVIEISFDVAELTIETAFPRLRPPSLLRFNMLLRDAAQRIFPGYEDDYTDPDTLYSLVSLQAQILEESTPLELSETNLFKKKDETLKFLALIMLDYSASMNQAAIDLVNDGQLDPGGLAPLDALYQQAIGPMIQELPDHYTLGLAVFNERRPWWQNSMRIITGGPDAGDVRSQDSFVSDKDILQYRLENTDVLEYGASPIFYAIQEAATTMYFVDDTLPDYDTFAEKMLITVTDGRVTTPPGDISATVEFLVATRVRFFPIGFGNTVLANSLIQFSTESSGHFYATEDKLVPDSFDPNGDPVKIPILSSLVDWCRTNPDVEDAQSLPRDLRSHVVLSYVSLNEESAIKVQGRLEVEEVDPPVKETFQVEQVPTFAISNDTKLGQIGMRTEGIQPDGTALVSIYADYIPRNIERLQFEISTTPVVPWTPVVVPLNQGGLVQNWSFTQNGGVLTLQTANDRPLAYGDYGSLVNLEFAGLAVPVTVNFTMLDPVYGASPDGKYFTAPDSIEINDAPFVATSFPNPAFDFNPTFNEPRSSVIEIDAADPPATLLVRNAGGEHMPTLAALYWKTDMNTGFLQGTVPVTVNLEYDGREPADSDYYLVNPDLNGFQLPGIADSGTFVPQFPLDEFDNPVPGLYSTQFYINVYYGSLFLEYTHGPYYLLYEVN